MQEHVLSRSVSRVLGMGPKGESELQNWRLIDGGFGVAMEKAMDGRVFV